MKEVKNFLKNTLKRTSMLGFIFATHNEFDTFRLNVTDAEENKLLGGQIVGKGKIKGKDICYAYSGCGKVNAAEVTSFLIGKYNPHSIVNIGLAGSVGLPTGTYFVSESVQGDVDLKFLKDPKVMDGSDFLTPATGAIQKVWPDMVSARLVTTDKFITTEAEDIKNKYGKCLVDMEGAAINWVCERFNKNYYGIKIVSDTCDEKEYSESTVTQEATPAELAIKFLIENEN